MAEGSESISIAKKCNVCQQEEGELLRCSRCKKVYYCGQECQKKDWAEHKQTCKKMNESSEGNSSHNKENVEKKKAREEGLDAFGKMEHIGSGNFSVIFKTTSKKDGKQYAIKQVEKAKVQRMRKEADVFMEKHCLNKLKGCPYVVELYHTFQD